MLRGMWLRMWSSINSPMRLLMAPRAAARRCRNLGAGLVLIEGAATTASSCPTIFLVRVSPGPAFSLDINATFSLDYPMGVSSLRPRGSRVYLSALSMGKTATGASDRTAGRSALRRRDRL